MDRPVLNIEYCHVTLGQDYNEQVKISNEVVGKVVEVYKDIYDISPYLMIDDLRSKETVTDEYIKNLIDSLTIKPAAIYLESSFIPLAEDILSIFEGSNHHLVTTEEERWLHQIKDTYGSSTDFLLSWKGKDAEHAVNFSCSTLVSASYLFRLGSVNNIDVKPIYGEMKPAQKLLNILPSIYMQTEANAQTIIEAYKPGASKDIITLFY